MSWFGVVFQKKGSKLIAGMLLIMFVPLMLIGYLSFESAREILVESAMSKMEVDAEIHAMRLRAMLSKHEDRVRTLANIPALHGLIRADDAGGVDSWDGSSSEEWKVRLGQLFAEMIKVNPRYLQIRYLDETGQEIVRMDSKNGKAVRIAEDKLQNKADRYYFADAIAKGPGELFISPLDLNREGSPAEIEVPYKPVMRYGTPVMDKESGEKKGVVLMNILVDDLLDTFEQGSGEDGRQEMLVDKDGYYLWHFDKNMEWGGPRDLNTGESLRSEYGDAIAKVVLDGGEGSVEILELDRVLAYYPVRVSQESNYVVIKSMARDVVLASVVTLRNKLALLALGLWVLAAMFLVWFARSIARPIGKLTVVADALSSGNLLARARVKSNDEIGVLAKSLNKMADSVLESRSTLEARVEERTKELSDKREKLEAGQKAILNILEDVEEEKERTVKLAHDLEKFRLAVENVGDHVVITNPDGIVLYANKAVEKITGYSVEEVLGKKAGGPDLWGGLMNKKTYKKFWKVIKEEKKMFVGELNNRKKSGENYVAKAQVSPILDDKGEVIFFVGIERDVTREKAVDQMKTDFISLASHQLRTPLSAMKWFLEMLLEGDMGKLSKKQVEAVGNVEQSNERMIALVNALLNVSRIESGRIIVEPEKTDIGKLVKSVVGELEEKFEIKKQKVEVSLGVKIPQIMVDPKLLRQVVVNLLTNANKYSPEKGRVEVGLTRKNKEVIVMVRDSGIGIPKSDQKRLFERFFRASNVVKQETDGTGLGLYLARTIVESSGGKMWFQSEEGKGTTFWFSIPEKGVKAKKGEVRLS